VRVRVCRHCALNYWQGVKVWEQQRRVRKRQIGLEPEGLRAALERRTHHFQLPALDDDLDGPRLAHGLGSPLGRAGHVRAHGGGGAAGEGACGGSCERGVRAGS